MPAREDLLFIGTYGHVVAVEKTTGHTVWTTSLPRTGYEVVSIVVEDGLLLCASAGRAFGLDIDTGEIRWGNDLQGLGQGFVYLTTASQSCYGTDASVLHAASRNKAATM